LDKILSFFLLRFKKTSLNMKKIQYSIIAKLQKIIIVKLQVALLV